MAAARAAACALGGDLVKAPGAGEAVPVGGGAVGGGDADGAAGAGALFGRYPPP